MVLDDPSLADPDLEPADDTAAAGAEPPGAPGARRAAEPVTA
jgi:hypothetical protein